MSADDILTTSETARELHLCESAVRKAANAGLLRNTRTTNGTRLFRRQDVNDYRSARSARAGHETDDRQ